MSAPTPSAPLLGLDGLPRAAAPVRLSRMDVLGRRDSSRWGGLSDVEAAAKAKAAARAAAQAARRVDPMLLAGPPLEAGGNDSLSSILQARLVALQSVQSLWDSAEGSTPAGQAEARKRLTEVHRFIQGQAGVPIPKPVVPREGDPPPPPPPQPSLTIDPTVGGLASLSHAKEIAPELLILAAETAANLQEWEMVWSCLSIYSCAPPTLSQYRIRGLLVQARAQAAQSRGEKGEAFLAHLQASMALCLQALQLLTANASTVLPAYNFLLYNTAATFMHVTRPLMRDGLRAHIRAGLSAIANALDEYIPASAAAASSESVAAASSASASTAAVSIPEKNASFEIGLLRALVLCTEECGDNDASVRFFGRAWTLLTKHNTAALLSTRSDMLRLAVHVLRSNPKALESLESEVDAWSRAHKRAFVPGFRALMLLQKLKSGILGEREVTLVEDTLKRCVELLTDPATEAAYEDDGEGSAPALPAKGRSGRKSPGAVAPAAAAASSASSSLSAKKKLSAAKSDVTGGGGGITPRDAAAQEVARLAALDAARVRDRARKKARSDSENERLGVLAMVGWEALQYRLYSLAQSACNKSIVSKRAGLWPAWIQAELLSVCLDVRRDEACILNNDGNAPTDDANSGVHGYAEFRAPNPGALSSGPQAHQSYATRIHGLKILDQTLSSALRLKDSHPELLELLCGEIWNLCRPMLQRNMTSSVPVVPKLLKACAVALGPLSGGGIDSRSTAMLEVRVLLHYEIALWEAANDYTSKALAQMEAAVELDYTFPFAKLPVNEAAAAKAALVDPVAAHATKPSPEMLASHAAREAPLLHLLRPYDSQFFEPLLHKLRIMSIMYDEPLWYLDSPEDQATRWVEQAREIKVVSIGGAAQLMHKQNAHLASRGGVGHARNHMKRNLLLKAVQLLDAQMAVALNSSSGVAAHISGTVLSCTKKTDLLSWSVEIKQKRMRVWTELVRIAFEQGFLDLLSVGVAHVDELMDESNGTAWIQAVHRDVIQMQFDVHALHVRACAHWVRDLGFEGPGLVLPPTKRRSEEEEALANAAANPSAAAADDETASPPTTGSKSAKKTKTTTAKGAASPEKEQQQLAVPTENGSTDEAGAKSSARRSSGHESKQPEEATKFAALSSDENALSSSDDGLSEDEKRRISAALFYDEALNRSLLRMLHIGASQLTGPTYAHLPLNSCVLLWNTYQRLFYRVLSEPAGTLVSWIPSKAADADHPDVRFVLNRAWEQMVTQAKMSSNRLRKPALMLQIATVLARLAEFDVHAAAKGSVAAAAESAALGFVQTALSLVTPAANSFTHASHFVYEPQLKKPLLELWARMMLRKGAAGLAAFSAAFASQADNKPAQLLMLLELLRSTPASLGLASSAVCVSVDEKRKWLGEGVSLLAALSPEIQAKLAVPLSVFNGETALDDSRPTSASAPPSRGNSRQKNVKRGRSADKSKRSRSRGPAAGEHDSAPPVLDPLDHTRKMNAATYAKLHLAWRELDTLLWTSLAEESFALNDSLLSIQLCYFGLQHLPDYTGPKLDLPNGIMQTAVARPSSAKPGSRKKSQRKPSISEDHKEETAVSGSPRSARRSPLSSPRLTAESDAPGRSPSPGFNLSSDDALASPTAQGLGNLWRYQGTEARSNVSSTRLRNYALLALIYGKSIVSLIDPARHSQPSQDAIRRQGLHFIEVASGLAAAALQKHLADTALTAPAPHLTLQNSLPTFEVDSAAQLILQSAKCCWNTALPMTYEPITRTLLLPFLAPILEHIETTIDVLAVTPASATNKQAVGAAAAVHLLDPAFRCELYTLYFACCRDAQSFEGGYASTSKALKSLPAAYRKSIWSSRILFMSRLGLDVGVGILKMKDGSAETQAKIWLVLARGVEVRDGDPKAAANREQKYSFYMKAIDVLEEAVGARASKAQGASAKSDAVLERVEVLIEFAEFLYASHFALKDTTDQLFAALDLLMGMDPTLLASEGAVQGARPESATASVLGGPSSASKFAKSIRGSVEGSVSGGAARHRSNQGSICHSRASPSVSGAASFAPSRSGAQTPSGVGSHASKSLGGSGSIAASHRHSSSGSGGVESLASPNVERTGMSVRHLFTLVRIYSMLGAMSSSFAEQTQNALIAQLYVERIWGEIMRAVDEGFFGRKPALPAWTTTAAAMQGSDKGTIVPAGSTLGSKRSSGGSIAGSMAGAKHTAAGSKSAAAVAAPVGAPAAASTPYVCLPSSPEEWLQFSLPLSIKLWFAEQIGAGDASPWSACLLHRGVLSPQDAVVLLHNLSTETLPTLERAGFVLQSLPVYYLMELLVGAEPGTDSLLRHRGYQSLLCLKQARVFDSLHQPVQQSLALARAEPILPSGDEIGLLRNLAEKREQLQAVQRQQQAERESARGPSSAGAFTQSNALQLGTSRTARSDADAGFDGPLSPSSNWPSRPGTAATAASGGASNMYGDDVLLTSESILASMRQFTPADLPSIGPDINIRWVWCELCELLLLRGQFPVVKQLLHEWLWRFCRAWSEDVDCTARMFKIMATIARAEGALAQALSLEKHSQAIHFGRCVEWTRGVEQSLQIISAQIYRTATPLPIKLALAGKQRSIIKHAARTFQQLLTSPLHRASNRCNARELKDCIARLWLAQATLAEEALTAGFEGFGLRPQQQTPSVLPVSFQGAGDQAEVGGVADRVGIARIDTAQSSASRPGSSGSVAGANTILALGQGHTAAGALAAYTERKSLQAEQQKLYEEVWAALEQAEFIYDDSPRINGIQQESDVDESVQPLNNAPALASVLLRHAQSLMRYSELFALPAAEVASATHTANTVLVQQLLKKVTQGTQALHQALLLLSRAESLLTSQLLLSKPATLSHSVSLPLQRQLHLVHLSMASIYLQLYRYKRPTRIYVDEAGAAAARLAKESEADILMLDGPDGSSRLTFADDGTGHLVGGGLTSASLNDQLTAHQAKMNELFFEKYESVFLDAETEAQRILDASAESALNEQALHLAASAANMEGSFLGVLRTITAATRSGASAPAGPAVVPIADASSQLFAVAPTSNTSSVHPRALLDHPAPFLVLGQALSALALEAREQAESDAAKQVQVAAQAKEQAAWAERVAAEAERAALSSDPRALAAAEARRSREEAESTARQEAEEREAEAQREHAARAQLIAENESRLQAEAAAAAASSTRGSKKKSKPASIQTSKHALPDLSGASSGEKHYNPELSPHSANNKKLSGREAKAFAAEQIRIANAAAAARLCVRPPFSSRWEWDTGRWSPARLQEFIERMQEESKQRSEAALVAEPESSKKGASKKAATPSPGLTSPKKASRSLETARPASAQVLSEPQFSGPEFPALSSLDGQAIRSLQHAISLCIRDEVSLDKLTVLQRSAIELADLLGTTHPIHAAKYLHLSQGAQVKLHALQLISYTSAPSSAESLVLARAASLMSANEIVSPELERARVFLRGYSEGVGRVSSFARGFFKKMDSGAVDGAEAETALDAGAEEPDDPAVPSSTPPQLHGHASYLAALSSLPDSMLTFALHWDAAAATLYAAISSRDPSSTLVSRSALSREASKEFALLLTQNTVLQHKIQRSVLVYGSLSNSSQLDSLERAYAEYLARLDAFMVRAVLDPIQAFDGLFRGRDVVWLISDPTLFALPLESLAMLASAKSVSRDFGLYVLSSRLAAAKESPLPSGINAHSVGFVVDALGQDVSSLKNPAFVGATGANMVAQAIATEAAAAQAAALAQVAASNGAMSLSRPSSGAKKSASIVSKKSVAAASASSFSFESNPLAQSDMVRILHELRSMMETPGVLPGTTGAAASGKSSKGADSAEKDAAAALAALRAGSQGWLGLDGSSVGSHPPVSGEWVHTLTSQSRQCGLFVYLGYESLLARVTPTVFQSLPQLQGASQGHAGTQAMFLFDRSVNERSYRAQAKLENGKNGRDRLAESTFNTALLVTLKGVQAIVLRSHHSSGAANAALAKRLVEHTLWEGASIGVACRNQHMCSLAYAQPGLSHNLLPDPSIAPATPAAPTGSSVPSSCVSSLSEQVDMLRYLDHALWSATGGVSAAPGSPSKHAAASSSHKGRGRSVGPTAARLRGNSPNSSKSKSPTSGDTRCMHALLSLVACVLCCFSLLCGRCVVFPVCACAVAELAPCQFRRLHSPAVWAVVAIAAALALPPFVLRLHLVPLLSLARLAALRLCL